MKNKIAKKQEPQTNNRVNIFNEMASLKDLVVWGEPGCETILGQLLPGDKSLFWKKFDVPKGRKEFKNMQHIFETNGIKVIRMKDVIADNPDNKSNIPKTLQELSKLIKMRGKKFYNYFKSHPDYFKKGKYEGDLRVLDWVDNILKEDLLKYGEKKAIALNWILCLSNGLPMANIMYARDQSNALGNHIILSRMKRDIRQPEVKLFRKGYKLLGYADKLVNLEEGNFEGGDAYIFGNNCLIGVDVRTNRRGVAEIYNGIKASLSLRKINLFAITYTGEERKPGEEMEAMHLDTYMMPLNENTILACDEEVNKRRVELVHSINGKIEFTDAGTLRNFLELTNKVKIVNISKKEQMGYSTNFLHLGHNKVVVPLEDKNHMRVNKIMRKLGLYVIIADIKELVGGYGAVHCMTAAIKRE